MHKFTSFGITGRIAGIRLSENTNKKRPFCFIQMTLFSTTLPTLNKNTTSSLSAFYKISAPPP